ncbi:Smr/MutS family protein [Desulfocastanea catecholica]
MKALCDVCGNTKDPSRLLCPFCGSRVEVTERIKKTGFVHKTVNLEAGRPVLEVALHRMQEIIDDAIRNDVKVLTLIHGYGSSGKCGVIRSECRKMLGFLKSKGVINDYIGGEDFNKRSGAVKSLLRRYPQLGADKHLNRGNQGITLVILSWGLLILPALVVTTIFNATFLS